MLFFIHILIDKERLVDHQGGDYVDLAGAMVEAVDAIRSIIAEEVVERGAAPWHWSAQIVDEEGGVVATIPFATALAPALSIVHRRREGCEHRAAMVERAQTAISQAKEHHAQIIHSLDTLRLLVKELDYLEIRAKGFPAH